MLLSKTLRSSTLRLAFVYITLFAAAIFGLFGYLYWSTMVSVDRIADREIAIERQLLAEAYDRDGRNGVAAMVNRRLRDRQFGAWSFLLTDPGGTKIAGNLTAWPGALAGDRGDADITAPNGARLRAAYWRLANGDRLLVSRQVDDLHGFVGSIAVAIAWAIGLLIVLAAAAGISTSRRSVARIEAINATSRRIMQAGLGQRIPKRGSGDEWDGLADNLNSMLDRIEELVAAHREVSDNIAHDLRTPLTRMRGRLERAAAQPLEPEQYRALVGDTIGELDGILRTFASLLRISQIEAHEPNSGFRTIELGELAHEVVELFDAAAEERGVRLELTDANGVRVFGDRDLLFEAIANLIDNALKHGGNSGVVTVAVRPGEIAVADHGPGIPVEQRQHVLKRFYRLERSRSSEGNGLGLSLVAAVASLHGGTIAMSDNAPGLRIALRFPPTPAQDPAAPGHAAAAARLTG